MMRDRIPALLFVLVLFGVQVAQADPLAKPNAPAARDHLKRGNRFYGVRSFDEAVAEYKTGSLGKLDDAIWHYQRFVTRGHPQGELLDAVNGFIAQMKAELDKQAPPLAVDRSCT